MRNGENTGWKCHFGPGAGQELVKDRSNGQEGWVDNQRVETPGNLEWSFRKLDFTQ